MCAINGITSNNEALVKQMNQATKSRGPDGSRVISADGVTFGHNRLSIIDIDTRSDQPMYSSDRRYTIVFNGEIYNYLEIRSELESSHSFVTGGDTEVLLAAFEKWGVEMFQKLRGIFAFAIWDSKLGELILARDHMGVKPLYYSFTKDNRCIFSSELQGVMTVLEDRVLDQQALSMYMAVQYVPSPDTLIQGVKKLPPSSLLRFKNGQVQIQQYWETEIGADRAPAPETVEQVMENSIRRQLVSDRPVGIFLSGGIDSSLILHHAAKHLNSPQTFSVAFEMVKGFEHEAERFNADSELAEKTAHAYGSRHKTFTLQLKDIQNVVMNHMADLDEPIANPTVISQFLLSKWVREDVVVALGGEGGDELFGGYPRHKITMFAHYYQKSPLSLQKALRRFHPVFRKLMIPVGRPMHAKLMVQDETVIKSIVPKLRQFDNTIYQMFDEQYEKYISVEPIMRYLLIDRKTWLADEGLTKLDKASMAHGLEVRVPLLDLDIVQMMDSVRVLDKFNPWVNKKVLRQTYKNMLPSYLFNQPKRGWISPGAKWLRDKKINAFATEVFSTSYYDGLDSLIDWEATQMMLKAHTSGGQYHLYPLWQILQLQLWAARNKVTAR